MKKPPKILSLAILLLVILLGISLLVPSLERDRASREARSKTDPVRIADSEPQSRDQRQGDEQRQKELILTHPPLTESRILESVSPIWKRTQPRPIQTERGEFQQSQATRGFESDEEEEAKADQPDQAVKWRMLQLVDENGFIPDNALIKAWEQGRQIPFDQSAWPIQDQNQNSQFDENGENKSANVAGIQPAGWTWLGPGNIGGRIRSIIIHPTDPQTMWVGSVGGGIWKTTNGGTSWLILDDFMANLAVGCMAIDPTNPNVLYAGTGEGFFNQDSIRGAGVFKTTDGGTTWTQLSSTTSSSWYYVNRLAINPTNGQIILAATNTGIWRSTDGGVSWTNRIATSSFQDINFNPLDGNKCIASGTSGAGARLSTDGGVSWNAAAGLPTSGRIEVAYAPGSPQIVYAGVNSNSGEIYRSTDGGQNYTLANTGLNYLGKQGWYDNIVWVDPTNSNVVIVGGIVLWRSTNGGQTFTQIGSLHADQHAIVESPQFNGTTNKAVFFGNDGGIYRTNDPYAVSVATTELNNNLGITQFYGGAGNVASGRIVGGTQDNGTLRYTGGTETWNSPAGGDGGFAASDPTDSNYFYGEFQWLQLHRSTNGGQSSSSIYSGIADAVEGVPNFISPFILDPNDPNTLLAGGVSLWRSTNAKAATPTWTSIRSGFGSPISAIAVAKGNSSIIWLGYDDGELYFTTNGTSASPIWTRVDTTSPGLPNRYCTRITIDPANSNRVYVTFGGFSPDNVWRTDNSGTSWSNITANLPSAPVRTLAVWQQNTNNLYVGTEVGIFASANGGQSWSPSNDGPTNCSVDELFWMNDTLVAATHGRGMFSINVAGGGGCAYSLSPSSQSFGSSGGNGSFSVTTSSGCAWVAMSNATWITTTSSGSGNGNVTYVVAANTGAARTGTITVGGQTFTVNESASGGGCPSTPISPGQTISGVLTTSDCAFSGTTRYVDVYDFSGTSGQQIAVTMSSSVFDTYLYMLDASNQTIAQDDDGGDGTNSHIPTNAGFFTLPATGTYTIYATSFSLDGTTGSTGAYTISLLVGSNCTYSLNPTNQIFISSASNGSFAVSTAANCSWIAVSNDSWLTTSSSGTGNGTVSYSVAANTGNSRTGTIIVGEQTFSVFQSAGNGNGCSSTAIVPGQTVSATLTTGCVFTGTSRYVDPYNFTGTAGQQMVIAMSSTAFDTYLFLNGPNNQTIAQDDDGGGGTNSRIPTTSGFFTLPATGTYTIYATSYSVDGTTGSTGPYTISLFSATSCSYSINPASQNVAAAGGSNSFSISAPAGCTWTALSNASWITTSSSGTGNGTINYSAAANTGTARTGTISVGGQLFTVNQSAGVQNYTITVNASPAAGGTVSGGGTFAAGSSRTVTATANANYTFANWTENGSVVSTSASYTFTLNGNRTLVANFNQVNISVTVQSNPTGRTFTVDGTTYSAAQSFSWTPGSSHTISTTSPQSGATGTQYVWSSWSDSGAISHSVVAPSSNTTYTANFTTQYFLTMSAGAGGTVSPASEYFNSGQSVNISATANSGFSFTGWTGSGAGSFTGASNPASVTMNAPITETASFTQAANTVQLSAANYPVGEGAGRAQITVTRTNSSAAATVSYRTTDTDTFTVGCADKVNNHGGAYGRCDFATVVSTLSFAAGETSKTVFIPIIDDLWFEGTETFTIQLSNPTGATLGSPSSATVTINDNDGSDGPNPIFTTPFFVRLHYLDFLGREPEAGEPWTNILNGCGNVNNTDPNSPSANCDRLFVSGSFFGSPEFKFKGGYVIGFYLASLNRKPTYPEFAVDLASVSGATAAEVFAKRAAFADAFVLRTEFANQYGALTNTAYVNALMDHYGLQSIFTPDPANPEGAAKVTLTRADLIAGLNNSSLTKAKVLRAIVQSDQASGIEALTVFVSSQYYGYLRRTPEQAGFDAWKNYLTAHPTDFRTMVNGFMNSQEYRLRFGPP